MLEASGINTWAKPELLVLRSAARIVTGMVAALDIVENPTRPDGSAFFMYSTKRAGLPCAATIKRTTIDKTRLATTNNRTEP